MFGAAMAFLRWLWPFFLESLFKDSTFRQWLHGNLKQFIWMLLWFAILLMLFQMIDLTRDAVQQNRRLQQRLTQVEQDYTVVNRKLIFKRSLVESLAKEVEWTRRALKARPPALAPSAPAPTPNPPSQPPAIVSQALQEWSREHRPSGKP